MELQHIAMKQTHHELVYKKQKLRHTPQQQVAMKGQQPMSTQVEKALPLQQAVVQEQFGSTMPLPTGLGAQAVWPPGQGAASGNAGVASCSAAAASGPAAEAGAHEDV